MIQVHFNKLVDGSMWLVNTHGIHSVYQSQATHYAKNNRLIPIGEDDSIQRQQELEEAEELLTKVCELVIDVTTETSEGSCLTQLEQVTCLPEWWTKRKPKSEREKKLEKIACALSLDGKSNPDFVKVAERVLKALENEV